MRRNETKDEMRKEGD